MKEFLIFNGLIAFFFMIPVSMWNFIKIYYFPQCDPKFGCLGVFYMETVVAAGFSLICMTAISISYYLAKYRYKFLIVRKKFFLIYIFCFLGGGLSDKAIFILEMMGVTCGVIFIFSFSLILSFSIFKFRPKFF